VGEAKTFGGPLLWSPPLCVSALALRGSWYTETMLPATTASSAWLLEEGSLKVSACTEAPGLQEEVVACTNWVCVFEGGCCVCVWAKGVVGKGRLDT
jgi:hypothetical protein